MNTTKPTTDEVAPSVALKPTKSKGERFFDWAVYGAMNYVGTFLLTMPLAYGIKHGKLKGAYELVDNKFAKLGLHEGFSGRLVKALQSTFITFWGGNAMLLPVRLAESYKVPIVTALNRGLGDDTDPKTIQEEPRQTWGTLIKGRLVAFGMTFGLMFGADAMFGKQFEQFQQKTGEYLKRNLKKMKPEKAFHYGEIAALDIFATAAASALLYVTSHFFARKREEKIERRAATHAPTHTVQADEAPSIEVVPNNAPQPTIEGARSLEGKAIEPSLAMANQV